MCVNISSDVSPKVRINRIYYYFSKIQHPAVLEETNTHPRVNVPCFKITNV